MEKHLCLNLFFNEVVGLSRATLLKKRLRDRNIPAEFWEIFKNVFFIEHLWTTNFKFICHQVLTDVPTVVESDSNVLHTKAFKSF